MERLVHIGLGDADKVLETFGYGIPYRMDDPDSLVALWHRVQDNAKGEDVVHFIKIHVLVDHLLIDAIEVFVATLNPARKLGFRHLLFNDFFYGIDILLLLVFFLCHVFGGLTVLPWKKIHERDIFQFRLNPMYTKATCKGSVDIKGFLGDFDLFLFGLELKGAHVVEAIAQLDQDNAYVIGHGKNHFPDVLGLTGLGTPEGQAT